MGEDTVTRLDTESFEETIANTPGLSVVKFYAPWCRTCRGIQPTWERVARKATEEYGDRIKFFDVNFKDSRQLCAGERIVLLPTVHFYLTGYGRVNRFTLSPSNAGPMLRRELARFMGTDLEMLLELQREGRDALVRYTDLVKVLQALNRAPALLSDGVELPPEDSLKFEAVSRDERRLLELEQLFNWLDKDSSNSLEADELAAITSVVRGTEADDEQLDKWQSLLDRIAAVSEGEGEGGAKGGASLDFADFVKIMVRSEVSTYASDEEMLPAFEALDLDQGGTITFDEVSEVVENMCRVLPDAGLKSVCSQPELLSTTFQAFDLDDSGSIDYEEFVMMLSGRGPESPYEAGAEAAEAV